MSQSPVILQPVVSSAALPFANAGPGEVCPSKAEIRAQLRRIVASKPFVKSDQLRRLLRHLVETRLQEPGLGLKETVLGMEVFGRGPDFDPRIDPIVRVEARRLRSRLSLYYHQEGCQDANCHSPGTWQLCAAISMARS